MSKRDALGRGASFAGRSARRNAIDSTITSGSDTTAITDLPVPAVSENPDNPRDHLRDLDGLVESVGEVGVILPIAVGTVDAYARTRPDRSSDLSAGAQYVVIDGHRRLEAARRAGLATIPVRVDDALLATDKALLETAFIANFHRDDMTDLEQAAVLQNLVEKHYGGSQIVACRRLGISTSTLSSKLSLLKLSDELKSDLMRGERKVEHVRNLSKLSPEAQKAKADKRAAETSKGRRSATRQSTEKTRPEIHAVKSNEVVTHEGSGQTLGPADQQRVEETIPEPRGGAAPPHSTASPTEPGFPFHDGEQAARVIMAKMTEGERDKVCELLLHDREERAATG
ncbi:ParB family protein [Streptomyces sp. KhCrAH-43]|uniref:ParB/RepB/Spo0J family partition protein n=1 Tax=unclassified Streptomyces TaxID=2593676 RepID=UPI000362DF16|nr:MULTISPECIES: ParB/RepB/Spo0J family partition protein [unclassified Streptomyces]MYS37593.1 ParB/RepB/Spo0J family partition protein [Streptomyces sp. SID4920]MYX68446.1 ParB/RepB/Spo0J family partition protein [Streptomyces sp. SID8373]RAJ46782.1 ParB family protein [Streptomyces sp. KhCrAH-43]